MRRRTKPTVLPLGTISEATLRPEDLIPAYLDALSGLRLSKAERATLRQCQKDWQNAECNSDGPGTFADDDLSDVVTDLEDLLSAHCPDYAYFGSLEGDGACFGVWPNIEDVNQSVHRIAAGDPFPTLTMLEKCSDDSDHFATVTDHGNMTLYRRSGNRWIEVWSVV